MRIPMENVVFGIPSYKRSDRCTTPDALEKMGVHASQIVIATQNDDDYAAYLAVFGSRYHIVKRRGSCLSDNRNTLIDCTDGRPLMMLDDDIRGFMFLAEDGNGKRKYWKAPGWVFRKFVETGFALVSGRPRDVFGFRPTGNPLCAHRRITMGCLIEGTCQAFMSNPEQRYDHAYIVKEDFEHTCRLLSAGGRTYRFDDFCSICTHFATDGTGCGEHFSRDREMTTRLCRTFPNLVSPCVAKPNIRFIPKTRKFKSFLTDDEMTRAVSEVAK